MYVCWIRLTVYCFALLESPPSFGDSKDSPAEFKDWKDESGIVMSPEDSTVTADDEAATSWA
jgi:hypothetical protein